MNIKRYFFNQIHHSKETKHALQQLSNRLDYIETSIRESWIRDMRHLASSSTKLGITPDIEYESELIVSLTSFEGRIFDTALAIESIMQGTVKPNRIILWLSEEDFHPGKELPVLLQRQKKRGLQIEYCENYRSYRKLIPAIQKYPDALIITIDDDAIYEPDLVERILNTHRKYPHDICACRMHRVKLDENRKPQSYLNWEFCVEQATDSPLNFPTGVGGVLYPPHCFSEEVTNAEVFTSICPLADDIWFYAMALLNNTPIRLVYTGQPDGYFVNLNTGNTCALSAINTDANNCMNDVQLKAVFEHYDLYCKLA